MSVTENSSTFFEIMTELAAKLRDSLAEEGVSQEIIDKVMGVPENSENLSQTYGRLLPSNDSKEVAAPKKENVANSNVAKADATAVTKQSWIGRSEVVVVTDYTPKEHAVFGDFVKTHNQFKDKYLKDHGWFQYNAKLAFGAGWRMMDKTKLPELRKALKAANIPFREISRDDFTKELTKKSNPSDVSEISEDGHEPEQKNTKSTKVAQKAPPKTEAKKPENKPPTKPEAKPSAKSTKTEPEKKPATKAPQNTAKPKITKNSYGNFEEEGTGLVFVKLPVGAGGKLMNVCVGYQYPAEKGEKGNATIYALTDEHIEAAAKNSHKILDDDMIEKVRESDPQLAEELSDITIRGIDELGDEDDDEELGEEEEDEVDDEDDDEDL